jgi:membrane protein
MAQQDAKTEAKKAVESLWKMGGLTPIQLAKRVGNEFNEDDISGRSAELAYYFSLALFPALLMMITLLGFFSGPGSSIQNAMLQQFGRMLPGSASELVAKTLNEVHKNAGGIKVLIGLVGALWSASAGVVAISDVLNICYEVKETRTFIKRRAVMIALTIALAVLVLAAVTMILYGGTIAEFVGSHVGLGGPAVLAWKIVQWPLAFLFMSVAFASVYYVAPNLEEPEWYWITPGSVVGFGLWIAASVVLRIYLHYFNSYSATYGSLGAVIILMLWFYLTGMAILLGGEVNSEIGHAQKEREKHQARLSELEMRPHKAA